jgi:uncharacterized protein YndB with AHSA1/START domain
VRASLESVWRYVARPRELSRWNPKLTEVHRNSTDDVRTGESFHLRYQLGNRRVDMVAEVQNCHRPRELTLQLRRTHAARTYYVLEEYRLREVDGATEVTQAIDITRSGIPSWAQVLTWFMHRFGKPTGQPHLETLRELAESSRHVS